MKNTAFQCKANICKVICFLAVASIVTCLVLSYSNSTKLKGYDFRNPRKSFDQGIKFQIIYLTQTEKCLPGLLRSPEVLGDTGACQCDVLVLSYKEECKDTSLPHVKYIYKPSTTWNSGRNSLYETAKSLGKFYFYYVFMDDDIELLMEERTSKKNPWRMFEQSLRNYQPAVAIVDPFKKFQGIKNPKDCDPLQITKLVRVTGYDAAFNAFHHQAVDHLLPYPTKFDNESWYYSQFYIILRGEALFHGQAVCDSRLAAVNIQHRPYPREAKKEIVEPKVKEISQDVHNEIPEQYQNISGPILQHWVWGGLGDYYCHRVPSPNTLITHVPYTYL